MPQATERLAALRARPRMGLAALSGLITALGLAPFGLWPLGLLGLAAALSLVCSAATRRQAALTGWAAGTGYFALALIWLVEPFMVDFARHGWMAPFALFFMCAGLALFWAAASALAHGRGGLALIAALALAELARSYVLTGFPWALLGYIWTESPMAIYASFIGPHGLTLTALAVALALSALRDKPRAAPLGVLSAAVLALLAVPLLRSAPQYGEDAALIRLLQPNAAQHEKWDPALVPVFFERQLGYSAEPTDTGGRPDLIVWPETSLPWTLGRAERALELITRAADGAPSILGVQRFEGRKLFNSLLLLSAQGTQAALYDKHHLVPFGEYIPFGDALAGLAPRGLAQRFEQGYSPGPGPALIDLAGIGTALPLICYEAVFPHEVNGVSARPALLLQITNDAWFGEFSGPYQHLAQARMRAIEQGLPLIRAANTGISAVIGPQGTVLAKLALGEAGYLDARLPAPLAPTLYARSGDGPALGLILVLLALGLRRYRAAKHAAP